MRKYQSPSIKTVNAIWRLTRDILLFAGGMSGIAFETVAAKPVNQVLLILFAAMCGLPGVLRSDNYFGTKVNEENDEDNKKTKE